MTLTRTLSLLGLLSATAGAAHADGLTRAQVLADLAEARRSGALVSSGETALALNELAPQQYPARAAVPALSRAQVQADLLAARHSGDVVIGEAGLPLSALLPSRHPADGRLAGRTRAEVQAELAEARQLGDLPMGEDGRTLAEAFPQRYAAVRARHADTTRTVAEGSGSLVATPR